MPKNKTKDNSVSNLSEDYTLIDLILDIKKNLKLIKIILFISLLLGLIFSANLQDRYELSFFVKIDNMAIDDKTLRQSPPITEYIARKNLGLDGLQLSYDGNKLNWKATTSNKDDFDKLDFIFNKATQYAIKKMSRNSQLIKNMLSESGEPALVLYPPSRVQEQTLQDFENEVANTTSINLVLGNQKNLKNSKIYIYMIISFLLGLFLSVLLIVYRKFLHFLKAVK